MGILLHFVGVLEDAHRISATVGSKPKHNSATSFCDCVNSAAESRQVNIAPATRITRVLIVPPHRSLTTLFRYRAQARIVAISHCRFSFCLCPGGVGCAQELREGRPLRPLPARWHIFGLVIHVSG